MTPGAHGERDSTIRRQAAEWVVRRDRGLSDEESIEFELWLADDDRHGAALQRSGTAWALLDRIPDSLGRDAPNRADHRRRAWQTALWGGLAAAVAFVAAVASFRDERAGEPPVPSMAAHAPEWTNPQVVTLSDGTVLRLNVGGEVHEQFTATERRVRLDRGEVHFTVTKDRARPFIVEAGPVEARAVGTAFNVHLQSGSVEVLVTEGSVAVSEIAPAGADSEPPQRSASFATVESPAPAAAAIAGPVAARGGLLLTAGQRATVSLAPVPTVPAVVVAELSAEEISRTLAWQEPLLRLSGATLADLAREFQRRTGYRVVIADPRLGAIRTGGRFRGDDPEGFVRILQNYGITSRTAEDGTIVLHQSPVSGEN